MRWGDMDAQGHVNNAAYVDYLQEARVGFLFSGPPVLHQLLESGTLVVSHQLEYLRPIMFSERPLTINLWWMPSAAAGSPLATSSTTVTTWLVGLGPV
jgi:acyl-CoA thioester hydrolase